MTSFTLTKNEPFVNWVKMKDEQKLKMESLQIYDKSRKIIEERLEEEKRRILSEQCYWRWFEKKTQELKERKFMEEEEDRIRQENEYIKKQKQALIDSKFNEWLAKKRNEENILKQKLLLEKKKKEEEKAAEIERKKQEKEHAKKVWKAWLEKKEKLIKEEKLRKAKEEEEKLRIKEEKRKLSQEKFKKWVQKSTQRPKPTRGNLGFPSLSCTNISYINPEPWKNILDEEKKEKEKKEEKDKKFRVLYKQRSQIFCTDSDPRLRCVDEMDNVTYLRTEDWVNMQRQAEIEKEERERKTNREVTKLLKKFRYKISTYDDDEDFKLRKPKSLPSKIDDKKLELKNTRTVIINKSQSAPPLNHYIKKDCRKPYLKND